MIEKRGARGLFFWTPTVAAMAALAYLLPGSFKFGSYQRSEILSGQVWRLLTCHLAHRSPQHLIWNLGAFLLLGYLAERKLGRSYPLFLLGSSLWVGAGLFLFLPSLSWYCGLSGVDSALFGYLLVEALLNSFADHDWLLVALNGFCGAGLLGKTAYELATGGAVFARTPGLNSVPLAHLLGALIGIFVMMRACASSSPRTPSKAA